MNGEHQHHSQGKTLFSTLSFTVRHLLPKWQQLQCNISQLSQAVTTSLVHAAERQKSRWRYRYWPIWVHHSQYPKCFWLPFAVYYQAVRRDKFTSYGWIWIIINVIFQRCDIFLWWFFNVFCVANCSSLLIHCLVTWPTVHESVWSFLVIRVKLLYWRY